MVVRSAARGGRREAFACTAGNSLGVLAWGVLAAAGPAAGGGGAGGGLAPRRPRGGRARRRRARGGRRGVGGGLHRREARRRRGPHRARRAVAARPLGPGAPRAVERARAARRRD